MATYTQLLSASFGAAYANLLSSARYSVVDAGGTTRIAATNTGITEAADADGTASTTGLYRVSATLDDSWTFPLRVFWGIAGQAGVVAEEVINEPPVSVNAIGQVSVRSLANDAITAGSIASNAITSAKIATDAIGAAQIAADAIGSSELATGAVTEIADAIETKFYDAYSGAGLARQDTLLTVPADVWAVGTRTLTSFGTLVSDVVTAVWGAATRTLSAFGFTVDTNANATETAIKAKTDNLPADPADASDIAAAFAALNNIDAAAVVTAIKADTEWKTILANAEGDWALTLPGAFPGTGTLVLKSKDGLTTFVTFTLTFNADGVVTERAAA